MAPPPRPIVSYRCPVAPSRRCERVLAKARRGVRASRPNLLRSRKRSSIKFATAARPVAAARPADGLLGLSKALRRWPLQKRRGQQCARHSARLLGEVRRKRPGQQRRAGEARPAGSRAWIGLLRNARGGWNHPTQLRASERHTGTCGGSPALLCAAAARGGYSTIHTKPYNPPAEVAPPSITAHTLRPPTAT